MKCTVFGAALTLISCVAVTLNAQDDMVDPVQESVDSVMLDCCCDCGGGLILGAEATFFKFADAGGVEDEGFNNGSFDYEVAPRITLGYVGCDGMGVRFRWWDYDHSTNTAGDPVDVDTYNIDLEAFQVVELDCCTSLELSAGIRYNDFVLNLGDDDIVTFNGIGGMVALEGRRDLNGCWSAYARIREAILVDDALFDDDREQDTIRPITEIALGVQYTGCKWTINAAVEWQNWGNYASRGEDADGGLLPDVASSQDDVGFYGFVIGGQRSY